MKEKTKSAVFMPKSVPALRELVKTNKERIVSAAAYFLLAFLFSSAETLFETEPLGMAFVCTVRENVPFAAAGYLLSYAVSGGDRAVMGVSGILVAIGFRYALSFVLHKKTSRIMKLNDGFAPRAASAASGAVTTSLIRIVYGGFRYYDLLAGVFFIMCAVGGVYAYSAWADAENRGTQKYEAGIAAMAFSFVLSLRGVTVAGVSAGVFASFVLTLLASRKGGALRGIVAGFICGAGCDLSLCPMFGTVGFLCGLFSPLSAYIGVLFSCIAGLFVCMQTAGFNTFTSCLPESAAGACTALFAEYMGALRRTGAVFSDRTAALPSSSAASAFAETAQIKERVRRLSEAYRSIADVTLQISAAERKPEKNAVDAICSDTVSAYCTGCKNRFGCYPSKGMMSRADLGVISKALLEKRTVSSSDLPQTVRRNCREADGMAAKLTVGYSAYVRRLAACDKAGAVSADCAAVSKILAGVCDTDSEEDPRAEAALTGAPRFRELFGADLTVTGKRRKRITASGRDAARIKQSAYELKRAAEQALSAALDEPEITVASGCARFSASTLPLYRAAVASSDEPKPGEIVNGDTSFYTEQDDRLFCSVCDGMGSGRDAAVSSHLAGIVLGRLLYAGCDRVAALETLNQIIRQRGTECFSTVDLFEADLTDGSAVFYKCGASPSFIIREGKAYSVASHTPPVGIMTKLSAEKIELRLKDDDTVVMISDGVTGQGDDVLWLCDVLCELSDASPETVCEVVTAEAGKRGVNDDMTVLAVKIKETRSKRVL